MKMGRKIATVAVAILASVALTASSCDVNDADVVNQNLDTDADNFKILRKVVFYNAILGEYVMVAEGFCSVEPGADRMRVTCKVGNEYMRHALGDSDNVLWWYEQIRSASVSPDHYTVVYKPETVIPMIEIR